MGLVTGKMSVTRFKSDRPEEFGWREKMRERLQANAFREPPRWREEVVIGWCSVTDLLIDDFDDFNLWLHDDTVAVGVRIAAKRLPAADFKAQVALRCRSWCQDRGVERCPASVKREIREQIADEWLQRTVPSSKLIEVLWDLRAGTVLIGSVSPNVVDAIRKLFGKTFGAYPIPDTPLDWVPEATRNAMLATTPLSISEVA